ncbi:MAG: hypothetical protein Q4G71_06325 [Pseudomonadota bacterium]|nr:hypothetical protein [Pseudomonadota bacterium]
MTEPQAWSEQRILIAALRGMMAAAVLVGLVLGWRYATGPRPVEGVPSVRVIKLLPATFMWASAPDDARYLPPGMRTADAPRLRLMVLRASDGRISAFYVPWHEGRATVPVSESPGTPGLPCLDLAPDFSTQDIACRQSAPGFDFALRHRWSLQGKALTPGTPDMTSVAGEEVDGDWLPMVQR